MKYLLTLAAFFLLGGCKAAGNFVVVGSASVESGGPDGKAVAKVEVRYTPGAAQPVDVLPSVPALAPMPAPEPVGSVVKPPPATPLGVVAPQFNLTVGDTKPEGRAGAKLGPVAKAKQGN